jgi:hypothetical protein
MIFLFSLVGVDRVEVKGTKAGVLILVKFGEKLKADSIEVFKADKLNPKEKPISLGKIIYPETLLIDTTKTKGEYLVRVYYGKEKFDTGWITVKLENPIPQKASAISFFISFFDTSKTNILIGILLFAVIFIFLLYLARINPRLYIRRIAGLDAIDEAVGRTAEMGRPIIYTTGIGSIDNLAILAGLTVLKHVTKKSSLYEVPVLMPNNDPLTLAAAREVVKEAYLESGRPDLYRENDIFFLTSEQFGFASGMSGLMQRLKPGAVFMMGYFYAESLILAENAYVSGAISTAGTTSIDQLPFFIASCDHTLIGDELYAASAYISRNPLEVASIKTGDWFKALSAIIITVGSIFATLSVFDPQFGEVVRIMVNALK